MTLETARAILNISYQNPLTHASPSHSPADLAAFEARLARLRPRRFVRLPTQCQNGK